MNQPESSLTIDGAPDPGPFVPIQQASLVNTQHSLDLSSTNGGQPWELLAALVPAQGFSTLGIATANGQTVNVNLLDPTAIFVNNGFGALFPAGGSLSIPFAVGVPATISAQMAVLDPAHPDGLVISHAMEQTTEICATQQSFDNLPTGSGVAPPGWVNPSSGMAWNVHTGSTTSSSTGPTSANSAPNYMYCETSGSGSNSNFVLDTCPIDLASLSSFTLNFSLSRIGATIGTLNVRMDDDGSGTFGTLLMSYTGADPTQAQGLTEWSAESIPFVPSGTAPAVSFRFEYASGTSFTGDLAIDDFNVQ